MEEVEDLDTSEELDLSKDDSENSEPLGSDSTSNSDENTHRGIKVQQTPPVQIDDRIARFLSSTPPIAESILSNLNAKDLNRCGKVCKLWNVQAKVLKAKRHGFFRMFMVTLNPDDKPTDIEKEDKIFKSAEQFDIGNHISNVLSNTPLQPKIGIIFCSEAVISRPHRFFSNFSRRNLKKKERRFGSGALGADYISSLLPMDCAFILCTSSGIIGTPIDRFLPYEFEENCCFSALFLTNIPGVEIVHFQVPKLTRRTAKKQKTSLHQSNEIISKIENLKCLLFFLEEMPSKNNDFFQNFLDSTSKIALGGVISNQVYYQNSLHEAVQNESDIGSGIALGGENLTCASCVLNEKVRKEEQIELKLKELKAGIDLKKNTIGFLFACCGRGEQHYGETNVETTVFHKIFPNVPLSGMFGIGEIGIDFFPKNVEMDKFEPLTRQLSKKWSHAYTSILVLISWN